jgi:hypothetical protein
MRLSVQERMSVIKDIWLEFESEWLEFRSNILQILLSSKELLIMTKFKPLWGINCIDIRFPDIKNL